MPLNGGLQQMNKSILVLAVLVATAAAARGPQPRFPADWTAQQADDMAIYQGALVLVFTH